MNNNFVVVNVYVLFLACEELGKMFSQFITYSIPICDDSLKWRLTQSRFFRSFLCCSATQDRKSIC